MLLAPDYHRVVAPYGLRNQSSNDLFDALNAAINEVHKKHIDETLLSQTDRTDLVGVHTCRHDSALPVPNRKDTSGFLRQILFENKSLLIGGLGPFDWGTRDGNYHLDSPIGFYPNLLKAIVENLAQLKGSDGERYGEKINLIRINFPNQAFLFQALLNGKIHATDVYFLIDASYTGTREYCTNNGTCRARELCTNTVCTHPARPRYRHFWTTCTTANYDMRFITRKVSPSFLVLIEAHT